MIQNEEFIQEFVDEAKSHVANIEIALLKKETHLDQEVINDVFRAVHSIKGTAGFFGLKNIVELGHAMENVLGDIRSERLNMTNENADMLLAANDCMKEMIEHVISSEFTDISIIVEQLNSLGANQSELTIMVADEDENKHIILGEGLLALQDAISHDHHVFKVSLELKRDLQSDSGGPIKFIKNIQLAGTIIETITNLNEIISIEDILDAVEFGSKDVYLFVIVSTALDKEDLSSRIDIPVDRIHRMRIDNGDEQHQTKGNSNFQMNEFDTATNIEHNQIQTVLGPKSLKLEDSVRVHVSILNDLLNMASEMVLGRNQLLSTLESYRKTIPSLAPILQNIDRLTSGMQEKIMQTRMQPVGNVFNKFPRIMRDISKSLSKEMELILEGENVELDKSMIEALTDPLTHLVRNAADHGLEMADIRVKAGKPGKGTITLKAYHEGGYVHIDVIDDGAGMDSEKIKFKALEKQLITEQDISNMTEQEILKLIFKPGFSTSEAITDISGRGVGMDVVRTNIEKIGGSIEIFSSKGIGSTIRLMLPLTLAIIQSLIVEVEGQKFALPQVNLKEIVKIKQGSSANQIEYIHDSEVLRLRGKLLPIVHLTDVLGIERTAYSKEKVIRVLVLKMGTRLFGIGVDSIVGSEETLVKPLPIYLKECICYSGVTIMGDGKTSLILDLEGIIRLSDLKFREDNELNEEEDITLSEDTTEFQNLLLFKCSGNETFAMDLSMVARVEEIQASDIEKIGDKEYIRFRNDSLQIVRPENYIQVNKGETSNEKLYVIIPKLVSHPIGIVIRKIYDNIHAKLNLNTEDIKLDGLVGSAIYGNKIILVINIYQIFEKAAPEHYAADLVKISGKRSLLLVEDTPFFQRMEKQYLEEAGYEVVLVENGKEALSVLESRTFDAIISDIQMPIMDGIELIKKIRANPGLRHLPVIAVTSMTSEYQSRNGLESGFDYYEGKLDRNRLLKTIEQAITSRKRVI